MAPVKLEHRRTHNLLLASKVLNQRDTASPFTLVLDHLEQSAWPLVHDCIRRAQKHSTRTIFVSLETLKRPAGIDVFVPLWQYGLDSLQDKLDEAVKGQDATRNLIIIDSLNLLGSASSSNLPALLSSNLRPGVSILAVYHTDVPLNAGDAITGAYAPSALNLLKYLATTIIHIYSWRHMLSQRAAQQRGHAEPVFGLDEGVEGVLVGTGAQDSEGLVFELEFRRKSGRGLAEWYFLPRNNAEFATMRTTAGNALSGESIILLEDHPSWTPAAEEVPEASDEMTEGVSFNLGLTERQRQDREGVVLPYFDAQKGGGDGGRILYDIGAEDDFDEEEDEI